MALNEVEFTIEDGGNTLRFRAKQMPATKLYDWLVQAGLALGGPIADKSEGGDFSALMDVNKILPALARVDYEKAKPLLEDLLRCCTRLLEGGATQPVSSETINGYITSPLSIFRLQAEALKANLLPLVEGGNFSSLFSRAAKVLGDKQPSTPTSGPSSPSSSDDASQPSTTSKRSTRSKTL